ncbi:hypothetical protein RFF73_10685, partial [Streptococcus ruminantium]|nr:hypothetical protein [Streptococcus ruminantium]
AGKTAQRVDKPLKCNNFGKPTIMLFIFQLLETLLFRRFWEFFLLLAAKKKIEELVQNGLCLQSQIQDILFHLY